MSLSNTNKSASSDDLGEAWNPSLTGKWVGKSQPYLRGPIPWEWLQRATELGGGALATGLAIWHLRALNGSHRFNASLRRLRNWSGLTERSTRTGLHRLEGAELVKVFRAAGKSPEITIIQTDHLKANIKTTA